ncbi:MAG: DsrE family protein [Gaiellales bacterium]
MPRLLVHIATGTANPTRAVLGLLVARTALEQGHQVDVFLAGDAVGLLRGATLDATQGIGTGSAREHMDAIVEHGGRLLASGMSSKARAVDAEAVSGLAVEFAPPATLVELIFAADRVVSY